MTEVVLTGAGAASGGPQRAVSLELLIFEAATAALADAGVTRADLDGVVISASDQVDGRAISSMLTGGPAGSYLTEEINLASSPAHALAMAYLQIMSGTHRRLLVSSWGKASESAGSSTQAAERLSAEPFFDRDGGLTALAAAAMQAQAQRSRSPRAEQAAAVMASHCHGVDVGGALRVSPADVAASPLVAHPLRRLEVPTETDGAFSVVVERADRAHDGAVALAGVGWCADSARLSGRDLTGLPHLARAAADAFGRSGATRSGVSTWELHDYTPDAALLAFEALGACERGQSADFVLDGELDRLRVNAMGGSLAGEPPFGGPLRKVIDAARTLRQIDAGGDSAVAQIASGFAGQFQSVFVLRADAR